MFVVDFMIYLFYIQTAVPLADIPQNLPTHYRVAPEKQAGVSADICDNGDPNDEHTLQPVARTMKKSGAPIHGNVMEEECTVPAFERHGYCVGEDVRQTHAATGQPDKELKRKCKELEEENEELKKKYRKLEENNARKDVSIRQLIAMLSRTQTPPINGYASCDSSSSIGCSVVANEDHFETEHSTTTCEELKSATSLVNPWPCDGDHGVEKVVESGAAHINKKTAMSDSYTNDSNFLCVSEDCLRPVKETIVPTENVEDTEVTA